MVGTLSKFTIYAINFRRWPALLLHYLIRPFGYLEFTDVYSIDLTRLPSTRELSGYAIERAQRDDIDYICAFLIRDEPAHVIRSRWSDGHHCFIARQGGKVIAYNWIAFSPVQEEEYEIQLLPGHAFCLDAYTLPEHRGKGLHYRLLLAMLEFAKQAGKTKAYTAVSLFNMRSWKSHIRMGWAKEFTIGYFRPYFTRTWLPWQITRSRDPVRLNWCRHSWFNERPPRADTFTRRVND
jgi:GNAT superfamily N-acetyltransferase